MHCLFAMICPKGWHFALFKDMLTTLYRQFLWKKLGGPHLLRKKGFSCVNALFWLQLVSAPFSVPFPFFFKSPSSLTNFRRLLTRVDTKWRAYSFAYIYYILPFTIWGIAESWVWRIDANEWTQFSSSIQASHEVVKRKKQKKANSTDSLIVLSWDLRIEIWGTLKAKNGRESYHTKGSNFCLKWLKLLNLANQNNVKITDFNFTKLIYLLNNCIYQPCRFNRNKPSGVLHTYVLTEFLTAHRSCTTKCFENRSL